PPTPSQEQAQPLPPRLTLPTPMSHYSESYYSYLPTLSPEHQRQSHPPPYPSDPTPMPQYREPYYSRPNLPTPSPIHGRQSHQPRPTYATPILHFRKAY